MFSLQSSATIAVDSDTLNPSAGQAQSNFLGEFDHFHKYARIKYEFLETKAPIPIYIK